MTKMKGISLINIFEDLSLKRTDIVIRLTGDVISKSHEKNPLEVIIFRGFTSCTTHPTISDPNQSTIPPGGKLTEGEVLKAPFSPNNETIILGPMPIEELTKHQFWR